MGTSDLNFSRLLKELRHIETRLTSAIEGHCLGDDSPSVVSAVAPSSRDLLSSPSIRDIRSSYVVNEHQQEVTKPNGYNVSVISDYIKDSYYSNLPAQSESAPPPPVVYDCYDEPNRNEIAEVLALLEAKAACKFLGDAIDSCEKVHDGLIGGTEWSRTDSAVLLLHSSFPYSEQCPADLPAMSSSTTLLVGSESVRYIPSLYGDDRYITPLNDDDCYVVPGFHGFIPPIFRVGQAKGEKVPVDTLTKCSTSLLNCDDYDVHNTATNRAAMGAVVDARDSARFPFLLAAGNLPSSFLTPSHPHDEADPDFSSCQDKELLDHLAGVLATKSVGVKGDQRIVPLNVTLKGKSVSVRANLNASLDGHQNITEDIHAIQYFFSKGAKVQRADDVIEPEVEKLMVTLPNRCLTNCFNLVDNCFI
jgi:hypothetical protein